MLETAKERIKLLKKGLSGKEIERLYIEQNNFKIICTPILYEAKEFDIVHSNFDNEGYFENSQITRASNQVIVGCGIEVGDLKLNQYNISNLIQYRISALPFL